MLAEQGLLLGGYDLAYDLVVAQLHGCHAVAIAFVAAGGCLGGGNELIGDTAECRYDDDGGVGALG